VIRQTIRSLDKVALGRVVLTSREHVIVFADPLLWNVGVGRLFFGPEIVAAIGKRSTAPCGAFVSAIRPSRGAYSRVCRAHSAVDCDLPFPVLTTRKRQLSKAVSAQIIASWL
jgi:hypothetical protein